MGIARILLWGSVGFVFYAYVGYPLLLLLLGRLRPRPVRLQPIVPTVSVIIAVHNEEARLREKIENTLELDYPVESRQIIIASDASLDATDEIARSFEDLGVVLVCLLERAGKETAQKLGIEAATGEILVFSDAATRLPKNALRNIVRSFADPSVGCVSSCDRVLAPDGGVSGEGAYVRYEMLLRTLESQAGTLVGLSGSFFAARRAVCRRWRTDLTSDFNTVLSCAEQGLRGVLDRDSVAYYPDIADTHREFDRKVRTVLRGITALGHNRGLLNPARHTLLAWQLVSHKLCRWLVPLAMAGALLGNLILVRTSAEYFWMFVVQVLFYAAAGLGLAPIAPRLPSPWNLPSYLILTNAAIACAWGRYVRGERISHWTPSQR